MATQADTLLAMRQSRALLYDQVIEARATGDLGKVVQIAEHIAALTSAIGAILPDFP